MMHKPDELLLDVVQQEIPVTERPFASVGERAGMTEEAVVERLVEMLRSGLIRRLGALFDSATLGYTSTLCSVDLGEGRADDLERGVAAIPEVTHCYLRSGRPAVWFTIVALGEARKAEIMRVVGEAAGGGQVWDLPARRYYKLHVRLPLAGNGHGKPPAMPPKGPPRPSTPLSFSGRDRALVRELQDTMPIVARPFAEVGGRVGMTEGEVVGALRSWQAAGALRRIGAVLYHREVGFGWNGMCRFPVRDEEEAAPIGAAVVDESLASHGYLRISANGPMPSAVYAMVHGRTREEVERAGRRMAAAAGVADPEIWWTEREIKKTSMRYFEEPGFDRADDAVRRSGPPEKLHRPAATGTAGGGS